jgi:hypothetical protein
MLKKKILLLKNSSYSIFQVIKPELSENWLNSLYSFLYYSSQYFLKETHTELY